MQFISCLFKYQFDFVLFSNRLFRLLEFNEQSRFNIDLWNVLLNKSFKKSEHADELILGLDQGYIIRVEADLA